MKKRRPSPIRKVRPPKNPGVAWSVDFRHTKTGVCLDISHWESIDGLRYKLSRTSYLLSKERLMHWCDDAYIPRDYSGDWTFKAG